MKEKRLDNWEGKDEKKRMPTMEQLQKRVESRTKMLEKLELSRNTKEALKEVALGTSKINYMDPRITVAWCKRTETPVQLVFNKALLTKFVWAMDTEPSYEF